MRACVAGIAVQAEISRTTGSSSSRLVSMRGRYRRATKEMGSASKARISRQVKILHTVLLLFKNQNLPF
jgi:hypothetical protein